MLPVYACLYLVSGDLAIQDTHVQTDRQTDRRMDKQTDVQGRTLTLIGDLTMLILTLFSVVDITS